MMVDYIERMNEPACLVYIFRAFDFCLASNQAGKEGKLYPAPDYERGYKGNVNSLNGFVQRADDQRCKAKCAQDSHPDKAQAHLFVHSARKP